MSSIVKISILGAPPSLKNNQALTVLRSGKPLFYTKPVVKQWQKDAIMQITGAKKGMFDPTDKLKITCVVYYKDNRRDLDREAVWDVLQKSGVVHNDRQFVEEHNYKRFDKLKPRVEIQIEKAPSD